MKPVLALIAALAPTLAHAEDLTCMPATFCIDDACQAGHDARLAVTLTGWTSAHPKLTSDFGRVAMRRGKGDDPMQWTGRNAEGQAESLSVRADMTYVHVVRMEPTSTVGTLTDTGSCEVTK